VEHGTSILVKAAIRVKDHNGGVRLEGGRRWAHNTGCGDSVVDSGLLTGVTCLTWHICSLLFRIMGRCVMLVMHTA